MRRRIPADENGNLRRITELLETIADRLEAIEDKLDEMNQFPASAESEDAEASTHPVTTPERAPH